MSTSAPDYSIVVDVSTTGSRRLRYLGGHYQHDAGASTAPVPRYGSKAQMQTYCSSQRNTMPSALQPSPCEQQKRWWWQRRPTSSSPLLDRNHQRAAADRRSHSRRLHSAGDQTKPQHQSEYTSTKKNERKRASHVQGGGSTRRSEGIAEGENMCGEIIWPLTDRENRQTVGVDAVGFVCRLDHTVHGNTDRNRQALARMCAVK